jgi:hypothetical protein
MADLRQISQILFCRQSVGIKPQQRACELPECRELSIFDIRTLILLESVLGASDSLYHLVL